METDSFDPVEIKRRQQTDGVEVYNNRQQRHFEVEQNASTDLQLYGLANDRIEMILFRGQS